MAGSKTAIDAIIAALEDPAESVNAAAVCPRMQLTHFIRARASDKHSGAIKIITHLDRISRFKTAFGKDWLSRRAYRIFIINTHRD